jgi:hypothetical protein
MAGMANIISYDDFMKLKPPSEAIHKARIDFGDAAEAAKTNIQREVEGFRGVDVAWEGRRMHSLTEEIHPRIPSSERPRVMLLFSNPHPDSVAQGLFMSEKRSRRFWEMLPCSRQLGINHDFCWNQHSIQKITASLLNGDYKGPLLFFDCLYQIPSKSPKDLKNLFKPNTRDFDCYLHRPSLERIGTILDCYNIKTVLVFTIETFESITDKPRIPKGSREILCFLVKEAVETRNGENFWRQMDNNKLKKQVVLPNLNHDCIAIKVMDTFVKYRWKYGDRYIFSWVSEYALKYAAETT